MPENAITEIGTKLKNLSNEIMTKYDKPTMPGQKPQDTSWHDSMVKAATDSFTKKPQTPEAVKKIRQSKVVQKHPGIK